MSFSKKLVVVPVFLTMAIVIMWQVLPKPELVISICIRLLAAAIALYIAFKHKEWRILCLLAMFILMATRQALTLLIWLQLIDNSKTIKTLSELPGFAVTLLSLISISYIGIMLSSKNRLIKTQEAQLTNLEGLLPICAKCKKIRDSKGNWESLESYISNRSEATFSHGICKECKEELYGGQEWYKNRANATKSNQ